MAKDPAIKYTDEELKDLEDKIKAVYSEAESDIQKKMDDFNEKFQKKDLIYQKQLKDGLITQEDYDEWKKGQVFTGKQWAAKKNEIAATLHNSNKIATAMINGSTLSVFAENSNYTAYSLEHDAGANFGFGLYNTDSVAKLIKEDPQLLPKWKVDQKKDYVWNQKNINIALTQGIIQGESLKDISKRVSSGLAGKNQNLMNTFAKTGMTQAQNSGRLERLEKAKKLGLNVKKEWIATLDNRTRFDHQQLDGQVADTDGYFKVGGLKIRYPGDPEAHPSLVYNCRCALGNHLVDYPSTYQRYDNIDGEPIEGMTYNEWKNAKGRTVKSKRKDNVANKKLIGGINDPELTDSIHDYFLPENTRKKLSEFEELHSYDDFKEYLNKKGIELDTDLEKLKTTMSQNDIPAVKEMMQKVVTAIDSYEEVYGPDALSALKRIKLYDQDLDTHAAYHFNLIGEDDPLAGTIRFSDWNASGRDIYHELAHAVQDSMRNDDEDVIIFANRLSKKVNIPKTAYSGTGELVGEEAAENMAENMAFGFARGNKKGMKFIEELKEYVDSTPKTIKKPAIIDAKVLNEVSLAERKNVANDVIEKAYGEYQYHATTPQAVFSIFDKGLKPNRGHAGKGIYFAPTKADALEWTATSSTGGTRTMRVKTSDLYKKYDWGPLDDLESIADKKISAKDIEIEVAGEWISLDEFVKRRYTSYRMWKANH